MNNKKIHSCSVKVQKVAEMMATNENLTATAATAQGKLEDEATVYDFIDANKFGEQLWNLYNEDDCENLWECSFTDLQSLDYLAFVNKSDPNLFLVYERYASAYLMYFGWNDEEGGQSILWEGCEDGLPPHFLYRCFLDGNLNVHTEHTVALNKFTEWDAKKFINFAKVFCGMDNVSDYLSSFNGVFKKFMRKCHYRMSDFKRDLEDDFGAPLNGLEFIDDAVDKMQDFYTSVGVGKKIEQLVIQLRKNKVNENLTATAATTHSSLEDKADEVLDWSKDIKDLAREYGIDMKDKDGNTDYFLEGCAVPPFSETKIFKDWRFEGVEEAYWKASDCVIWENPIWAMAYSLYYYEKTDKIEIAAIPFNYHRVSASKADTDYITLQSANPVASEWIDWDDLDEKQKYTIYKNVVKNCRGVGDIIGKPLKENLTATAATNQTPITDMADKSVISISERMKELLKKSGRRVDFSTCVEYDSDMLTLSPNSFSDGKTLGGSVYFERKGCVCDHRNERTIVDVILNIDKEDNSEALICVWGDYEYMEEDGVSDKRYISIGEVGNTDDTSFEDLRPRQQMRIYQNIVRNLGNVNENLTATAATQQNDLDGVQELADETLDQQIINAIKERYADDLQNHSGVYAYVVGDYQFFEEGSKEYLKINSEQCVYRTRFSGYYPYTSILFGLKYYKDDEKIETCWYDAAKLDYPYLKMQIESHDGDGDITIERLTKEEKLKLIKNIKGFVYPNEKRVNENLTTAAATSNDIMKGSEIKKKDFATPLKQFIWWNDEIWADEQHFYTLQNDVEIDGKRVEKLVVDLPIGVETDYTENTTRKYISSKTGKEIKRTLSWKRFCFWIELEGCDFVDFKELSYFDQHKVFQAVKADYDEGLMRSHEADNFEAALTDELNENLTNAAATAHDIEAEADEKVWKDYNSKLKHFVWDCREMSSMYGREGVKFYCGWCSELVAGRMLNGLLVAVPEYLYVEKDEGEAENDNIQGYSVWNSETDEDKHYDGMIDLIDDVDINDCELLVKLDTDYIRFSNIKPLFQEQIFNIIEKMYNEGDLRKWQRESFEKNCL